METETGRAVCGQLVLDLTVQTATFQGVELCLTALEFNTLAYLAQHPGQFVCAEILLDQVWHCETGGTIHQVKSCIKRLRHKLGREALPIFTPNGRGGIVYGIPPLPLKLTLS